MWVDNDSLHGQHRGGTTDLETERPTPLHLSPGGEIERERERVVTFMHEEDDDEIPHALE